MVKGIDDHRASEKEPEPEQEPTSEYTPIDLYVPHTQLIAHPDGGVTRARKTAPNCYGALEEFIQETDNAR